MIPKHGKMVVSSNIHRQGKSPRTFFSGLGGLLDLRRSSLAGSFSFWSRNDVPEICLQRRRFLDLHVMCVLYVCFILFCCGCLVCFFLQFYTQTHVNLLNASLTKCPDKWIIIYTHTFLLYWEATGLATGWFFVSQHVLNKCVG